MKREIKFRAWANEHNRYCDFTTLNELGRWVGWIQTSGVYTTTTDIALEQCTGLKCEGRKEIYEGDILRYKGVDYIVAWEETYACFEALTTDKVYWFSLSHLANFGEVVGNIHENPELLEVK